MFWFIPLSFCFTFHIESRGLGGFNTPQISKPNKILKRSVINTFPMCSCVCFEFHFKASHCLENVQIRSYFWSVFSPNTRKYGSEITRHLDTFQAVSETLKLPVPCCRELYLINLFKYWCNFQGKTYSWIQP